MASQLALQLWLCSVAQLSLLTMTTGYHNEGNEDIETEQQTNVMQPNTATLLSYFQFPIFLPYLNLSKSKFLHTLPITVVLNTSSSIEDFSVLKSCNTYMFYAASTVSK